MDKIIEIDKNNLTARLQPNVTVGRLQQEVEKLGLFFPPDPSNLAVSTVGGAVALGAGGPRTLKYGGTKDYIINLKVVTQDGEIMQTSRDIAKNVTGYNLTQLFVGSEGTLGIITEITVKLIAKPEKRLLTLAYFDSIETASNVVSKIIASALNPSVIDLLDQNTLQTIEKFNPCGLLTDKAAALLIELDGLEVCTDERQKRLGRILNDVKPHPVVVQARNEEENEAIWRARRSAFGCVAKLKPNVITEDVVVPRTKIPEFVAEISRLSGKYGITVCIMG
ncbi:glycolate oxidase, partial [Candidatus Gastranaerophilus sp. (ex Termes propinquus)]